MEIIVNHLTRMQAGYMCVAGIDVELGVTDIRLFGRDHVTPDWGTVARVARKLANEPRAILSVGLTRPYSPTADGPPIHWLQVNNIYFADETLWQLGPP